MREEFNGITPNVDFVKDMAADMLACRVRELDAELCEMLEQAVVMTHSVEGDLISRQAVAAIIACYLRTLRVRSEMEGELLSLCWKK